MKKFSPLVLALVVFLLAACTDLPVSNLGPTPTAGQQVVVNPGTTLQTLPADMPRPQPVVQTVDGCPPEGDGGDREMNRLKNRVDAGDWMRAGPAAVLALTWPQAV